MATELGLAIKAASPFETTLVIELTNDGLAYIPTKTAFAEGSYEDVSGNPQVIEAYLGKRHEDTRGAATSEETKTT
jgi:hypothetical protein